MTETVHTQITAVEPKQGQKGPFWVIKYQGGSGTAWEVELAVKASNLINQAATLEIERKGQYTNIKEVKPSDWRQQAIMEAPVASQEAPKADWAKKDRSIRQQNALGTAFRYASRLSDHFENLDQLEAFAFQLAGRIYANTNGDDRFEAPVSDNSEEVVRQIKEQLGGEVIKKGVDW